MITKNHILTPDSFVGVDSEEELENATTSEHILKILQARSALYERHFDIRIWPR